MKLSLSARVGRRNRHCNWITLGVSHRIRNVRMLATLEMSASRGGSRLDGTALSWYRPRRRREDKAPQECDTSARRSAVLQRAGPPMRRAGLPLGPPGVGRECGKLREVWGAAPPGQHPAARPPAGSGIGRRSGSPLSHPAAVRSPPGRRAALDRSACPVGSSGSRSARRSHCSPHARAARSGSPPGCGPGPAADERRPTTAARRTSRGRHGTRSYVSRIWRPAGLHPEVAGTAPW